MPFAISTPFAISAIVLAQVGAHAAESHDEVCGLLLGTARDITSAVATANVAADPCSSFEIDPAALLGAHRQARARGEAVIGHYHSHPAGGTRPSPRDAAMAIDDGVLWLIVAGDAAAAWVTVADGAVEGRFEPVALTLLP